MLARCPICNTRLPLARVWRLAQTVRGMVLRVPTGVVCSTCGQRLVILQGRAVIVGFVSFAIGGFAGGMILIGLGKFLHHPLSSAQMVLVSLMALTPQIFWQFWIVPLFCRVRPVTSGETVDFPERSHGPV